MAIVRKSLVDLKATRPKIDRAKMAATTESDINRHIVEDGQALDAALTGYAPTLPVQTIRRQLGMTQEQFAFALHIPLPTLRNWEQGRTLPDPAARALLTIVSKEPEAALRALKVA
jgi:putative transcriptional regulator